MIDKAKVLTKTLEVESAASTTAVIEEYIAATNTVERATNLNKNLPLPVVPTGECNQWTSNNQCTDIATKMTSTTASIAKVAEAVSEAAMDYNKEKSAKHDYQYKQHHKMQKNASYRSIRLNQDCEIRSDRKNKQQQKILQNQTKAEVNEPTSEKEKSA